MVPKLVIESVALLRGIVKSVLLGHAVEESAETLLSQIVQTVIPALVAILLFGCEIALAHWNGKIGRALEDLQFRRYGRNLLDNLYTRRASADDCNTFVLDINTCTTSVQMRLEDYEIQTFFRPERGVMNNAIELI